MYHIVYKTTNTINNKIYIGIHSTSNLNDGYIGSGVALKHAINKYGISAFTREIIYTGVSRDDISCKEQELVTEQFCTQSNNYNMRTGGDESYAHHPETRKKISAAHSGRKQSVKRVEQMRDFMLTNNPMNKYEHRESVRQSKLGKPRSQELKNKVSDALKGRAPAFLNPRVKKNPELQKRWLLLDQIYDKYQEGLRYSTLLSAFSDYFPGESSMSAMIKYFNTNGDPRKDPRWLQFRNDTSQ